MGLKLAFQNAAQTVVTAFGDVPASTVYRSYASTTYNASAGTDVTVYSSTIGVKLIFDVFQHRQIDGTNIQPEDKRALIPANNIPGVTPKPTDQIREGSTVWNVVNVISDPAGALWDCQIRKS